MVSDGAGDRLSVRHILTELRSAHDEVHAAGQRPARVVDRREVLHAAERCATELGDGSIVSVVVGPPSEPELSVSTSPAVRDVNGVRALTAEGPARTAWDEDRTVTTDDLSSDPRWPLAARVADVVAARAVVAVPVRAGGHLLGILTVYRPKPGVDAGVVARAEGVGASVAATLRGLGLRHVAEVRARQLQQTLESRETIDLAKGILMACKSCGPDEAFAALVEASQTTNTKLRDIAAAIVSDAADGRLPSL